MILQGRDLSIRMKGADVEILQHELQQLGFVIPPEEASERLFGQGTRAAVREFQKRQGVEPTGVVDEITARAINEEVDSITDEFFHVSGTIRSADGSIARSLHVHAFHVELQKQNLLGKAETDSQGDYEIAYHATPFRSADGRGPNLRVVAFSQRGERLGSSDIRFNAGAHEVIDLTIDTIPETSEYEHLLDAIAPAVGETPIADLTDTQLDFLARSTQVSPNQLHPLVQAAKLASDTELLSPAVFYGFLRLDQPTDLRSLLAEDIPELRRILLTAIEQRVIPARIRDNLEEITTRLEQLRIERGVIVPVSVSGRLLDEESERPLPGLSIRILDMADPGNPVPIEEIITDEDGTFAFTFLALDTALTDGSESSRTFRLSINEPGHDEFHTVEVTVDRDMETLEVRIPSPPRAEPVSLAELANRATLDLPDGLLSELEAQGIITIEDLRAAGPLDRIVNLPDDQGEGVRKLEAHVRLSTLSQDIESNDALINAGYTSVPAIGRAPRLEFANTASVALGDFGAVKARSEARVLTGLMDLVVADGRVVAWDPNAGTSAGEADDSLIDDIADLFPSTCSCGACSNASSPLAYLADLIDYAQHNLKHFEEGATIPSPVTVADLENRFHQPLGELPVSCDQVSQQVNQVRICIEVLRRFLSNAGLPAAGTSEEEQLRRALKQYVERAYTSILSGIGSSYDEIRTAHSAESETRESLADRLGIVLEPDRPDLLDRLFLPPESLNEEALERLFGLVNTTRDPLQRAATPEFLEGRLAFLRAAWQEQDETSEHPIIDPDLIGPGYLKEPVPGNPAYDLWQARFDEVRQQVESLNEARNTASSDLAWLDESVQQVLGVTGEDLFGLEDRLNGGESIDADLATLNLAFDAFTRLVRLRRVLVGNDPILDNEADDVVSILVQVHKRGQFASWWQDERDAGIVLGPDHFIIPGPPLEFPLPEPQPLPEWRATYDDLRVWENALQSRIEEEASAVEVLKTAVRTAEEEALPLLRDGLIAVSGQTARKLTERLLIDCEADACYITTRIAQAIQTVQAILWSIRTGQLSDTHPDLELVDDDFDTAWRWLGSYETWRAAMSVFLYPENVLLPSLRPYKTPAFERVVNQTRTKRRINPEDARRLAGEYEEYFLDIANLSLGATCVAETRIYSNDQRGKTGREARDLFYMFAKSEATQTIYWSSFDPADESGYAQSFWRQIPDVKHVSRIDGAVPYRISAQERYLYLFFTTERDERKQLYSIRLNLEQEGYLWDTEPTPITLKDDASDFKVVIKQSRDDRKPPELVVRIPSQSGSFDIYRGQLTQAGNAQNYHVKTWNLVLSNTFRIPLATVGWGEDGFLLFTGFPAGGRLDIHFHSGAGAQGGTQGETRSLTKTSGGVESWQGAFRWPGNENLVYAFWAEGQGRYASIWGTDTNGPVQKPEAFLSALLKDLAYIAPHSGTSSTLQNDRLTLGYQTSGIRGGPFRSVLQSVNAGAGHTFFTRSSPGGAGPLGLGSRLDIGLFEEGDLPFDRVFGGPFEPEPTPPPPPEPPPDPPPPNLLQLSEASRTRITPLVARPLEIIERLSESELQVRRSVMAGTFGDNEHVPSSIFTYLEEAYYFVPVHLALQLQHGDHFVESLDWFRTVFDYSADPTRRKIYHGLRMEESLTNTFQRLKDWLQDPLTPHTIASTRRNAYTRFTVLSIIRCFLKYADREFTRDTAESVARARTLYLTALDLLGPSEQQSDLCELLIVDLDRDVSRSISVEDSIWRPVWDQLKKDLRRFEDAVVLRSTVEAVRSAMGDSGSLPERLAKVRELIREAQGRASAMSALGEVIAERGERLNRLHALLQKDSRFLAAETTLAELAGNDLTHMVAEVTGISGDKLKQDKTVELPWLRQRMTIPDDGFVMGSTPVGNGFHSGNNSERFFLSPRSHFDEQIAKRVPLQLVNSRKRYGSAYLPTLSFRFCVPVNPVLASIRLHAELNLYKIRTCRNIAGDKRSLEPYAIVEKGGGSVLAIGADAQISLPLTRIFSPTPYRYPILIERAKQLVGLAQQMEAALLSALEKLEAEELNLLRARQEIELSQAGVQLQTLRLREAENSVILAELQRGRAQIQANHFQRLLAEGLLESEKGALESLRISTGLQALTGVGFLVAASLASSGAAAIPLISSGLSSLFGAQSSNIQRLNLVSSFERRRQDWQLASSLASQDVFIGEQQTRIARDQVRVVAQERDIAFLRASHAQETLEFLANKFTNVELYEYMSEVLNGVYHFFLQLATATAQLAASQLAFERQHALPAVIQTDYWEVPSEGFDTAFGVQNNPPDRRGITGSARLLQDIFRLDQFAFETDQRKLQLTKTISLARLGPAEFQRFRETGVLRFNTPMEMFDGDFPGHYLRLIKSVRTSVIALIPPTESIKAMLATTGISRVVIDSGRIFQTIEVRRPPEAVALSSPINATGLFELTPQTGEMLFPFEGMGVDTAWEFQMPKAANQFDYRTIADVLLTIEYTTLNSFTYRQQVIQELDDTISADRPFSFRQEFADQWYDLNHPDLVDPGTGTPMVVEFTTRREDFPPNMDELRMQHVVLFFARKDAAAFEVPANIIFRADGSSSSAGGSATSIDGIISTRRGNASSWTAMIGALPVGTWTLNLDANLSDGRPVRDAIRNEEIEDILFVITYQGQTPAWPA